MDLPITDQRAFVLDAVIRAISFRAMSRWVNMIAVKDGGRNYPLPYGSVADINHGLTGVKEVELRYMIGIIESSTFYPDGVQPAFQLRWSSETNQFIWACNRDLVDLYM